MASHLVRAAVLALMMVSAGCAGTPGAGGTATAELSDAQRSEIALARRRNELLGGCKFVHGFAEARALAPDVIGDCVENEKTDPGSGDAHQRTNRGLLVWRKADGLIAFTDGHRTWVRGPDGWLRARLNDERFSWEATPEGSVAASVRVVTPGPPLSTPTPAPSTPVPTPQSLTPGATRPALGTGPTRPTVSSEPPKPLQLTPSPKPP